MVVCHLVTAKWLRNLRLLSIKLQRITKWTKLYCTQQRQSNQQCHTHNQLVLQPVTLSNAILATTQLKETLAWNSVLTILLCQNSTLHVSIIISFVEHVLDLHETSSVASFLSSRMLTVYELSLLATILTSVATHM